MHWIFLGWMVSRLFALDFGYTTMDRSSGEWTTMEGGSGQPPTIAEGGSGQPPTIAYEGGSGQPPALTTLEGGSGQPPTRF